MKAIAAQIYSFDRVVMPCIRRGSATRQVSGSARSHVLGERSFACIHWAPPLVAPPGERVAVIDAVNNQCHNRLYELGPAGRRVVLYSSADREAVTVMVSATALSRLEVFVCRSTAALAIGRGDGCAEMET